MQITSDGTKIKKEETIHKSNLQMDEKELQLRWYKELTSRATAAQLNESLYCTHEMHEWQDELGVQRLTCTVWVRARATAADFRAQVLHNGFVLRTEVCCDEDEIVPMKEGQWEMSDISYCDLKDYETLAYIQLPQKVCDRVQLETFDFPEIETVKESSYFSHCIVRIDMVSGETQPDISNLMKWRPLNNMAPGIPTRPPLLFERTVCRSNLISKQTGHCFVG